MVRTSSGGGARRAVALFLRLGLVMMKADAAIASKEVAKEGEEPITVRAEAVAGTEAAVAGVSTINR